MMEKGGRSFTLKAIWLNVWPSIRCWRNCEVGPDLRQLDYAGQHRLSGAAIHKSPWRSGATLALAHRRHTQKFTRASQHTLGGAGDGHQPLVIAVLGNELQADRHTKSIEAYGQRCRA